MGAVSGAMGNRQEALDKVGEVEGIAGLFASIGSTGSAGAELGHRPSPIIGLLKINFSTYQIISQLASAYNVKFPPLFYRFVSGIGSIVTLDLFKAVSSDCWMPIDSCLRCSVVQLTPRARTNITSVILHGASSTPRQ